MSTPHGIAMRSSSRQVSSPSDKFAAHLGADHDLPSRGTSPHHVMPPPRSRRALLSQVVQFSQRKAQIAPPSMSSIAHEGSRFQASSHTTHHSNSGGVPHGHARVNLAHESLFDLSRQPLHKTHARQIRLNEPAPLTRLSIHAVTTPLKRQSVYAAEERVVCVSLSPTNLRSPASAEVCDPPSGLPESPTSPQSSTSAPSNHPPSGMSSAQQAVGSDFDHEVSLVAPSLAHHGRYRTPVNPSDELRHSLQSRENPQHGDHKVEGGTVLGREAHESPGPDNTTCRNEARMNASRQAQVSTFDFASTDAAAVAEERQRQADQHQRQWLSQLLVEAAQALAAVAERCAHSTPSVALHAKDAFMDDGFDDRRSRKKRTNEVWCASTVSDSNEGDINTRDSRMRLHALEAAVIREQQTLLLTEKLTRELGRSTRKSAENARSLTESTSVRASGVGGADVHEVGEADIAAVVRWVPENGSDTLNSSQATHDVLCARLMESAEKAHRRGCRLQRLRLIAEEEVARESMMQLRGVTHASLRIQFLAELHENKKTGSSLLQWGQERHSIGLLAGLQARAEVLENYLHRLRLEHEAQKQLWSHQRRGLEIAVENARMDAGVVIARYSAAIEATVTLLETGARERVEACEKDTRYALVAAHQQSVRSQQLASESAAALSKKRRSIDATCRGTTCELLVQLENSERRCLAREEELERENKCVLTRQLIHMRMSAIAEAERRRRKQERERSRKDRHGGLGLVLTSPPRGEREAAVVKSVFSEQSVLQEAEEVLRATVSVNSTPAKKPTEPRRPAQSLYVPISPSRRGAYSAKSSAETALINS